jgi:hypothetical protein
MSAHDAPGEQTRSDLTFRSSFARRRIRFLHHPARMKCFCRGTVEPVRPSSRPAFWNECWGTCELGGASPSSANPSRDESNPRHACLLGASSTARTMVCLCEKYPAGPALRLPVQAGIRVSRPDRAGHIRLRAVPEGRKTKTPPERGLGRGPRINGHVGSFSRNRPQEPGARLRMACSHFAESLCVQLLTALLGSFGSRARLLARGGQIRRRIFKVKSVCAFSGNRFRSGAFAR